MRQKHPYQTHLSRFLTKAWRCSPGLAALLLAVPGVQAHALASGPAPTRTTLAAAPGTNPAGTMLTATVATSTGTPVASGTVDFLLPNGQSLGSAVVAPNGTATLALKKLPAASTTGIAGTPQQAVTAAFHANSSTLADSGSVATEVTTPAATTQVPDFTVTGNPTTVTTPQGSYGTTAITVTSVGGYAGEIQFSCSDLPAQVTCAFNPTQQLLAANGSFVTTLELQTQSASGTASSAITPSTHLALALAVPGALVLFGLSGRRRKGFRGAQFLATALVLGGMGMGLSGCSQRYGYLKHPPPVAGGTPTGTFPITVAVDGSQGESVIENDVTISLVVQ